MFKGFQRKNRQFNGFPNLNFQVNNEAYDFSGCTFWLDAAYGTNTQTNLGAVSIWTDRITNSRYIQNTAANQPRYVTTDANFNNLPSIDFYDTARRMQTSEFAPSLGTIAVIAKVTTPVSWNMFLGNGSTHHGLIFGGSGAALGIGKRKAANTFWGATGEDTNSHIVIITESNIVIDNVDQTLSGTNEILGAFDWVGGTSLAGNSFSGKIAEILNFRRQFTLSEMQRLSENLNSKYAIY